MPNSVEVTLAEAGCKSYILEELYSGNVDTVL